MDDPPQRKIHKIHRVPCGKLVERTSTEYFPMDPPWLGAALLHIEQNLGKPLSAGEIFTVSGHGAALVERTFKEKLGTSVQSYINRRKLSEAKHMLGNPDLRISEIAYACGYKTPQYFCKIFTDAFGRSPKAYRTHAKLLPAAKRTIRRVREGRGSEEQGSGLLSAFLKIGSVDRGRTDLRCCP